MISTASRSIIARRLEAARPDAPSAARPAVLQRITWLPEFGGSLANDARLPAKLPFMSSLSIEFEPDAMAATAMFRLHGRASYREAGELRTALFDAITVTGEKNLVVELEDVVSIDTAAMAVLIEALKATHDRGPDMYLVCATESVRLVFRLAGLEDALTRCFSCMADMEQAIAV